MKLNEKAFLIYKLFNSSFTGLSIGILFTIYNPLDTSVYAIGGIILAAAMLLIATFYEKLLNIKSFFYISLIVELMMLFTIIIFMFLQYSLASALLIYMGYQFTFIFGGYLVRAETLVAEDKELLGRIDVNKQVGYLVGLGASFLFYKALKYGFQITEPKIKISILHYLLIGLQSFIIILLLRSFSKERIIQQ